VPCKFNLIPFNPFPASGFKRSPALRVRRFAEILMQARIITTTLQTIPLLVLFEASIWAAVFLEKRWAAQGQRWAEQWDEPEPLTTAE
jgi:hypothetical protein